MTRYDVHADEDYQPGSTTVLKNFLNICDPIIMAQEETKALEAIHQYTVDNIKEHDQITIELILKMHKQWLGHIYPFAGRYRTVLMSKDNFVFAAPAQIERLMSDFEKKELRLYTPCHRMSFEELSLAMSIIHTEFIIIHPFREGNGRLSRLIVSIMGLQAGYPPLNFSCIDDKNTLTHAEYIKAIHHGLDKNYDPMKNLFTRIIRDSLI